MSLVEKAVSRMKAGRAPALDKPKKPVAKRQVTTDARDSASAGFAEISVTVDHDALVRSGYLASEKFERRLAEEFRHIKRPLLEGAFGVGNSKVENGNLVMVGSALPGEGKTHTCINLALSMAMEKDRTVLLVDADVANPTVSRNFGLEDAPGFLDLLDGDVTGVAEVLVKTSLPRLRLLPAGRVRESATELLASDRTRAIVDELQSRYRDRIIVFDSPPLLATSEALVLAKVMGQIVMVVSAESTPRSMVKEALSMLDPDQSVSLVLNKTRSMSGGKYGYYGSYGVYGQTERGRDRDPAN